MMASFVIESLAILDYLEAKYPTPTLLPKEATALALVRMVQMVSLNELGGLMIALIRQSQDFLQLGHIQQRITMVLLLFEDWLGDRLYFGADHLTLADVVAGTLVPWLPWLDMPLTDYPRLSAWSARVMAREAWQKTQISPEAFADFKRRVRILPRVRKRQQQRTFIRA